MVRGRRSHAPASYSAADQQVPVSFLTAEQERASVQALRRFERRCYVVAVTDAVLARVRRPFPVEPIRTLDAVHLATAELLGRSLWFAANAVAPQFRALWHLSAAQSG